MKPSNRLKNENSMYLYINKNADIKFSVYDVFQESQNRNTANYK